MCIVSHLRYDGGMDDATRTRISKMAPLLDEGQRKIYLALESESLGRGGDCIGGRGRRAHLVCLHVLDEGGLMLRYRLLALDMDGTLLNSQKKVSPRTASALAELAAAGVPIAFCTGRNVAELTPYLDGLQFIRYGILVSGALVRDLATGNVIACWAHQTSAALEVVEAGRIEDAMVHVLAVNESFISRRDMTRLEDVRMGVYRPLYQSCARHVDDIADAVRASAGEVLKVNLYHLSQGSRARSRARLEGRGMTLSDAETTSLECSPAGVSKARGLQALCEHVGCTLEEVVMVGDAENDLEALRVVGMPVAMGNAVPEVVRVAKLQVADCDHDGVAEVAERLF